MIVAADGETRRLPRERRCSSPPESPGHSPTAVRTLSGDPELAGKLAERAGDLARKHLREVQAERLVDLLEALVRKGLTNRHSAGFPATSEAEVARLTPGAAASVRQHLEPRNTETR